MKRSELDQWQHAVDAAEDETRDHLDFDAPVLSPGESWADPDNRIWRQVPILYGKVGGRWCYWKKDGVIVDEIFNGWASHFAGMLRVPYDGHVESSLMLSKEGVVFAPSSGSL